MLKSMTLLLFLAAAVTKDMQTYRIPNGLLVAGAVNGCLLRLLAEGWQMLPDIVAGAILPLIIFGGLFALSMIGAADVKLLMAVGIYAGSPSILRIMFYACVIGAGLSLVKLIGYGLVAGRRAYFLGYFRRMAADGIVRPYIDMRQLDRHKEWLLHFSVPVLLAVLFELIRCGL